jgi:hypothetical protein
MNGIMALLAKLSQAVTATELRISQGYQMRNARVGVRAPHLG